MITRRTLLKVLGAGTALAGLAGCGSRISQYRQKMTVEVETPSGLRTGSSVIEVRFAAKPDFLSAIPGNGFAMRGEAVLVDFGQGQLLFALLRPPLEKGSDLAWYQTMLFSDAMLAGASPQPPLRLPDTGRSLEAHAMIGRSRARLMLPPDLYPMLVTFPDPTRAQSVVQVDPQDLAASFGAGVRLKAISLEITDKALTTGLAQRLRALGIAEDMGLDPKLGVSAHPTLAQLLSHADFISVWH